MNFIHWNDYLKFQKSVVNHSRFFLEDEARFFLKRLVAASNDRKKIIAKGVAFYRAQHGYYEVTNSSTTQDINKPKQPHGLERMKPSAAHGKGGRANPPGVSYLYLSTNKETAMSEIRPWVGAELSCAKFVSKRDLVVADFITNSEGASYLPKENTLNEIEKTVFYHVNNAFSEPVNPEKPEISYVPTQIIAEYFKVNKYDGIAYSSSLGPGYNLVIFDVDSCNAVNCQIFKTDKVKWDFAHSTQINY